MGFFEWLGLIFATGVIAYAGGAVSAIVFGMRGGGIEAFPVMILAFAIGALSAFLLALWLLWGVNFFPFLEATK